MQSKHDLFTLIITLVVIVSTVLLGYTGKLTGGLETACLAGIGMIFTYWFARGGSIMANNQPQQTPQVDTQALASAAAQAVLTQIAQTPAQPSTPTTGVSANAAVATGSGGNQSGN